MRAAQVISYTEKNFKESIVYSENITRPICKSNQVIVKNICCSTNPIDYKYAGGFLHHLGGT